MTKLKNIVAAVATIVIFTNITHAQALTANYPVKYEEPLAVKYIGNDGEYLTFEVTVQSEIPGNALFAIADEKEGELFSSRFSSRYKVQTIKIEKRDDQVLDFKLVIGKQKYSKSFSVDTDKVETTTVAERDVTIL